MSLVHRLAAVLFTVTAAACATVGCAESETVVALTINPDQSKGAPLIEKIHVKLVRGSLKVERTLKAPDPTAPDQTTGEQHIPSFYERFIVDGWDGKVKISAEGEFEGDTVEAGEAEAVAEAQTAIAAAVTMKTPATIEAEEAAAKAAGAGGCACPCGAGGSAGEAAGSSNAGGAAGSSNAGGAAGAKESGGSNEAGGSAGSGDSAGNGDTGGAKE